MGGLAIETDPKGKPASALAFLSGNGSTIGNVTAKELELFTRPVRAKRSR